jgi:Phosphopantetheine attachment site
MKDWSRKSTLYEKLYTMTEPIAPPFAIQYIIEGEGLLDPNDVQSKLEVLAKHSPALKLKLKGNKWSFDGDTPVLKIHDSDIPSNMDSSVFRTQLNSRKGHCCEFHLFQSSSSTLLVRVLHSAMDGIGVLILIERLFALLRGESISTIQQHTSDYEIRKANNSKTKFKVKKNHYNWIGLGANNQKLLPYGYITEVIDLNAKIHGVVGKIAKWYMNRTSESGLFLIPVNARRHDLKNESVSNLSLPLYLRTKQEESPENIQANMLTELSENHELGKDNLEIIGRYTPKSILSVIFKRLIKTAQATNKYPISGYISDIGRIELPKLSTAKFKAQNVFSLPVFTPLSALCLTICTHENGTRIAFSVHENINITQIKEELIEELTDSDINTPITTDKELSSELIESLIKIWSLILKLPTGNIDCNQSFDDLGGESIDLVLVITEVSDEHLQDRKSEFMSDCLKLAGRISINTMCEIASRYNTAI